MVAGVVVVGAGVVVVVGAAVVFVVDDVGAVDEVVSELGVVLDDTVESTIWAVVAGCSRLPGFSCWSSSDSEDPQLRGAKAVRISAGTNKDFLKVDLRMPLNL